MFSILLIPLLTLLVIYYFQRKKRYDAFWKYIEAIPGPKGYPLIGTNYRLFTPESLFLRDRRRAETFYPIYKVWSLNLYIVCLLTPEDIELVLNNSKQNGKSFLYSFLHAWLGTGLLTSEGSKWHKRRKILTPAFHFTILQEFLEMLNNETDILVHNLKKMSDKPYVDVMKPITEFTLYSIGETSLGVPLRDDPDCSVYKQAVHDYGENFCQRIVRPWLFIPLIYKLSSFYKNDVKCLNVLHSFSTNIMTERKKTFTPKTMNYSERKKLALLDLLLKAKYNGADINDEGIREELDTFIFEGHDTTSLSLCYTLMALANEQDIQEKLYEEIISVTDTSKPPTYQELGDLKYMERCIKESLRLYPSVPVIGRVLKEEIKTKTGYIIPKGCNLNIFIYDLHRRPEIWENPEKYDPDRFLPEHSAKRHPFAYIPFSAGSRNCIGQRFGMMEIKAALYGILKNFKLDAVTKPEDIIYKSDLVLRPSCEIRVKFLPRK